MAGFLGPALGVLFTAIVALVLGLRAFTEKGIPLTKEVHISGRSAKIIGTICLVYALLAAVAAVATIVWVAIETGFSLDILF